MHYFVVGVNASGKTSLLKAVSQATGIDYIHGTSALMSQLGIPGDYDALRALDQDYVLEQWGILANSLVKRYGTTSFFLDAHILNLTRGAIIRRDGPWIAAYDELILVTAPTNDVFARISADKDRDRALFTSNAQETNKLVMLSDYQTRTEALLKELGDNYAVPTFVIENKTGLFQQAVQQLVERVQN